MNQVQEIRERMGIQNDNLWAAVSLHVTVT